MRSRPPSGAVVSSEDDVLSPILRFIADTLLSLVLYAFLLRLMMQWARANFRNPIAEAILRLTNWLILPLRRVLPPIGRVDTASVVAVGCAALLKTGVLETLWIGTWPALLPWLQFAALEALRSLLWLYFWGIFVYALASMIAPGVRSPLQDLLGSLCEPILGRIRRAMPVMAGLDLSPLWAGLILQVLLMLLG